MVHPVIVLLLDAAAPLLHAPLAVVRSSGRLLVRLAVGSWSEGLLAPVKSAEFLQPQPSAVVTCSSSRWSGRTRGGLCLRCGGQWLGDLNCIGRAGRTDEAWRAQSYDGCAEICADGGRRTADGGGPLPPAKILRNTHNSKGLEMI